VPKNIALKLPYPKIEKTVPQFLTIDEYNRLIRHFSRKTQDVLALGNLIIISDSGAGPVWFWGRTLDGFGDIRL